MACPGLKNNTSEHLKESPPPRASVSYTGNSPFLIMNSVGSFLKHAYLGRYRGTNKDLIPNAALKCLNHSTHRRIFPHQLVLGAHVTPWGHYAM